MNSRVAVLLPMVAYSLSIGLLPAPATGDVRTWSDQSGKFQVQAELVEVADGRAKLKRTDGKVITVPVAKLSDVDQEFLESSGSADAEPKPPWELPLKVGDKVYIRVRKQWQLAKLTNLNAGSGSARFEVQVMTGSDRRKMRVTEKRIRRYGKAGDQGALLPGDVVEVKKGFDWKPGEIVSVDGKKAMVQLEGALAATSTWVSYLRVPGSGDAEPTKVASASGSSRSTRSSAKKSAAPHPTEALPILDDPELTTMSFDLAEPVDFARGDQAPTIELDTAAPTINLDSMRPLPIKLIPLEKWGKGLMAAASADGSTGFVLRKNWDKHYVEIVPLKDKAKSWLAPVYKEVAELLPSPDGARLVTIRRKSSGYYAKADLWDIVRPTKDSPGELKPVASWSLSSTDSTWFLAEKVLWTDNKTLLSVGKEGAHDKHRVIVQWDLDKLKPSKTFRVEGDYQILPEQGYVLVNEEKTGLRVIDLKTLQQIALVGAGKMMAGRPTVSPSGRWLLVSRDTMVEFWDLHRGNHLLQSMLVVPGVTNKPFLWSNEEPYLKCGERVVDVRDLTLASASLKKRSARPLAWSVSGNDELALTATRRLTPLAEPAVTPKTDGPFRYRRGMPVTLQIVGASSVEREARSHLTKMLKEQETPVIADAKFIVRATLETLPSKTEEFGKFGARKGDTDNVTVTYTPRKYTVELLTDGESLASATSWQTPGMFRANSAADIRRAVQDATRSPKGTRFPKLSLPERVIVVGEPSS